MLPVFLQELKSVSKTVDMWHYCMDHTTVSMQLMFKLAQGVKVRMIFDRSQFYWSSSARQALR
eukprot:10907300-Karenia_brevis.AAC.1